MGPGDEQFVREGQFKKYRQPILKDTGQRSLHTTGSCGRHSNLKMGKSLVRMVDF